MVIRLREIEIFAYHGVYPEERKQGTTFILSVECTLALDEESFTDAITETVDYVKVYELVYSISTVNTFELLETWAKEVVDAILDQFQAVTKVTVIIQKPGKIIAPNVKNVEVEHTHARKRA